MLLEREALLEEYLSGTGGDRRKKVADTRTIPWRWICSIRVRFPEKVRFFPRDIPGDTTFGTGLLITPRHVLTCAHILVGYRQITGSSGGKVTKLVRPSYVEVIPARDDDRFITAPFRRYSVPRLRSNIHIPLSFLAKAPTAGSAPHDYAVINLEKNVGLKQFLKLKRRKLGWWSRAYGSFIKKVTPGFRRYLATRKVNVAGYPQDKDPLFTTTNIPAGLMYHDFNSVRNVNPRIDGKIVPMMTYHAYATKGQSGAPIWIKSTATGKRMLVGINTGSELFSNHNHGVLLTPVVIQQLLRWNVPRHLLSLL